MQCRISCRADHAIKIVWPYLVPPDCVHADMRKTQWMTTTTIKLNTFFLLLSYYSHKNLMLLWSAIFFGSLKMRIGGLTVRDKFIYPLLFRKTLRITYA